MKRYLILILMIAGVMSFQVRSASAFEASENVSLWFSNNLTIETANLTINSANVTVADIEESITAAAEAGATIIAESQADASDALLILLIVTLLNALAFWQKHPFLYCLMVPLDIVYGLYYTVGNTEGSGAWVAGIIIALVGTFCLFRVVMMGLKGISNRKKRE
jgi:hypothetical protein